MKTTALRRNLGRRAFSIAAEETPIRENSMPTGGSLHLRIGDLHFRLRAASLLLGWGKIDMVQKLATALDMDAAALLQHPALATAAEAEFQLKFCSCVSCAAPHSAMLLVTI